MENWKDLLSSSEYTILEKIGEGAMGIVLKAKLQGKMIALKVISPKVSKKRDFQKRFLREMQVVATLDHPNIVKAIDFGVDLEKDIYFVALEYIDGKSLKQIIDEKGRVPLLLALEIGKQIAAGLQHAYENDVVHRDIKPDNILIGRDSCVKITDFGLVKGVEGKEKPKGLAGQKITSKQVILGSPLYMAPERALLKPLDIRSDIYSLGVTLFHALTGRPPYIHKSSVRIIAAHAYEPFPKPSEYLSGLPPQVDDFIMKATAKKPEDRFQTPKECHQRLVEMILELKKSK
ncbi:MAG: serine/threonine protein kinase [Planctomycetota bacterium]|nr:MAG: serine/threonine protein kinase [Planctomycetota bacterium]